MKNGKTLPFIILIIFALIVSVLCGIDNKNKNISEK
jgi:hypothetical protein